MHYSAKHIGIIGCCIFLCTGLILGYSYTKRTQTPPQDWTERIRTSETYTEALALRNAGDYDKAVDSLEALKAEMGTTEERSVVEMDIAGTLFRKDPDLGAQRYAAITRDTSFPRITRATAMLMMYLQFSGTRNPNHLKYFYTEEEFTRMNEEGSLAFTTAQNIHQTFPFVIAGAVLAREEMRSFDPSFPFTPPKPGDEQNEEAERIYQKYFALFDSDIAFLERSQGMKTYVPNTYLTHANYIADLHMAGYAFRTTDLKERANTLYTEGLARARAQGEAITEEFISIRYAEFLFSLGRTDEAETLITTLSTETLSTMFKQYLITEKAKTDIPKSLTFINAHYDIAHAIGLQ